MKLKLLLTLIFISTSYCLSMSQIQCEIYDTDDTDNLYDTDEDGVYDFELVDCLTLGVELLEFRLDEKNTSIDLNWITKTETNNSHFEIERSVDGIHFEKIGKIEGHGTINTEVSYIFKDRNPLSNVSYYRLKQVDFDGQFEYSDIVSIVFWSKENVISPNHSTGLFYINRMGRFQIYNSLGRFVAEMELQEPSDVDLSELAKGIYYVKFLDHTEKIIKM